MNAPKIEISYTDESVNGEYIATATVTLDGNHLHEGRLAPLVREERIAFIRQVAEALQCTDAEANALTKMLSEKLLAKGRAVMEGPELKRLDGIEPKAIEWLWRYRMALGKLSLIFGDPGLGKSFLTLDMIARVTTGSPWPDSDTTGYAPLGDAILISAEDALDDTIVPRLIAAGADLSRVHALEGVRRVGEDGKAVVRGFTLADIPTLEDALSRVHGCKLVVIDPVSAYLSESDSHNNAEIRGLLAPLQKLAEQSGAAVVMVTHMSKGGGGRALYRAMGSLAFAAAARSAWVVVKDADNERRRMLLPAKNNIGNDRDGLAYSLAQDDEQGQAKVVWEAAVVTMTADDALAAASVEPDGKQTQRDEAQEFLKTLLDKGPKTATEVFAEAKQAGVSQATLNRAKLALGIKPKRRTVGNKGKGEWVWGLPWPHPSAGAGGGEDADEDGQSEPESAPAAGPAPQDVQVPQTQDVSILRTGEHLTVFDPENAVSGPRGEGGNPQDAQPRSVSALRGGGKVVDL